MLVSFILSDVELEYSPDIDLESGIVESVELAPRVSGDCSRRLCLEKLVSSADELGIGDQLTSWLIDAVLADAAAWRREGWFGQVSLNIPRVREGLSDCVGQILGRHAMTPDRLALEFTALGGSGLPDPELRELTRLRELGVTVTLDNVGVGHSINWRLGDFPWDIVKFDRSVPAEALPHGVAGVLLVAMGLETPEDVREQRRAGTHRGQGNVLAAPMRPEDLGVLLTVGGLVLPA